MMRGVAPCCCNVQGMEAEVDDQVRGRYIYIFGTSPLLYTYARLERMDCTVPVRVNHYDIPMGASMTMDNPHNDIIS